MLVAAMLVSSLASCSESKVNEEKETTSTAETVANVTASEETEEETKKYLDDLPEKMDFGGTSMRFIVEEGGNGNLSELSIMAEEDTGEVVDSAVFTRNASVQERLNINIVLLTPLCSPVFRQLFVPPLQQAQTTTISSAHISITESQWVPRVFS